MTTLPPATDFTGALVTNGQMKTAFTSLRAYLSELLGDDSTLRAGDQLLINGEMNVAQEGASFTGVGAAAAKYTLDQWLVHTIGSPQGRATVTQESGVFTGFGYSAKIDTTTAEAAVAAGEVWAWQQRLEAQNLQHLDYGTVGAKSLVCTFKVKSPKTGTHCVALFQPDGARSFIKEFTVSAVNTAEEKTVVFTGDASGTINNGTGEGLRLSFPLAAGATYQAAADSWAAGENYATANQQNLLDNVANNFEITGVRLRLGNVATAVPFVHQGIGADLVLCERFFKRFDTGLGHVGVGFNTSTTTARILVSLKTTMRAAPTINVGTITDWEVSHTAADTVTTNLILDQADVNALDLNATVAAGLTDGQGCTLRPFSGPSTATLDVIARL